MYDTEDDDLSNLDRGDSLTDEQRAAPDDEPETKPEDEKPAEEPAKPETETETEIEAEAETEADDEDTKNYKVRIAKALSQRDAERQARQDLENRLRELEARIQPTKAEPEPDPVDALNAKLDTLYMQVEEARADAKVEEAAKLQRQIDAVNREILRMESSQQTVAITEEQREAGTFNRMLDHLETVYPELVKDSDDYDPTLVRELNAEVELYEKAGLKPTVALSRAVALLFRENPFAQGFSRAKAAPAPAAPAAPATKKVDVKKAIEAERRQPPSASDRGVNSDERKIDPSKLSEEEFDALPESTKRKLRGDDV